MRAVHVIVSLALLCGFELQPAAQTDRPSFKADPPRFSDPNRRAKLSAAFADIDRVFQDFVATSHVPGAAWGIIVDGELAHTGSTGYSDVTSKVPVDVDTVFRIASMTKSFTAISILQLRDRNQLSLDDPADRYVPELKGLPYPTSDSPTITIRHLLSHSEGFPEDNPWGDRQLADTDEQMSRMIERGIPFSNAPGVAYEYSNYGFAILGRIVSKVSGVPYADYVQANILRPLGMTATTLEPTSVLPNRLAHGYRWEDDQWKEEPQLRHGAFGAMGGMLTSIRDLSKYVAMFMDAWPPRDGADDGPIRRSSLREMQQMWRPAGAAASRDASTGATQLNVAAYGFGLRISQTCTFRDVSHGGGLPGFGSTMRWLPEHGVGIIALGNLTYTVWGRATTAAIDLLAKTGGLQPRAIQPSHALVDARDAVSKLIVHWDDQLADRIAAENLFLDISKDRRRAGVDELHATYGACMAPTSFDHVENALRGTWTMACERGRLRVTVTLAPTMPPTVQFIGIAPATSQPPTDACQ